MFNGMMKQKKINYLMLSALFLLQTLTLPIALPELALCVAEDHVRLEMQNLPADCKHDGQSRSALKHTDHMDDCADVAMFQHVRQFRINPIRISGLFIRSFLFRMLRKVTVPFLYFPFKTIFPPIPCNMLCTALSFSYDRIQ